MPRLAEDGVGVEEAAEEAEGVACYSRANSLAKRRNARIIEEKTPIASIGKETRCRMHRII